MYELEAVIARLRVHAEPVVRLQPRGSVVAHGLHLLVEAEDLLVPGLDYEVSIFFSEFPSKFKLLGLTFTYLNTILPY